MIEHHTPLQGALVFLGAAVLLVPIFLRLGLGTVLGYLAAGSIIGPNLLGWIKDYESVASYAELGVVFLLFIIGLELQPKRLWAMKRNLLGFGGMQIFFCTLVFFLIGKAFGLSSSASFVIGFSLSLSSTAFALQTLTERKVLNTQFGRASFSILLMQDVAAIPALALIPSLGILVESAPKTNWYGALLIAISLYFVSRFLMRPFLRIVASGKSRELFTGVTLLIVMGVAFLMQQVGLSMALGAFIAGVLLSESEYKHELEADLEPFKGILMGLFFISVGMAVNWQLALSEPLMIIGLTVGYLLIKGLLIFSVGKIMKLNNTSSRSLAIYLVQGGEFAFVIFGVGQAAKVITAEWAEQWTLVVTLSMVLSPILILVHDKIESWRSERGPEPEYDKIENQQNPVIIAGFGRFGQIVGRILRAQNIGFTAIEQDSEQIELLRRFNNRVFYGDASRIELLESAGAKDAKYLIIAVDDVETATSMAREVRQNFPHLKIYSRARNRQHVFELMDLEVHAIQRETFEASLALSKTLLKDLGFAPDRIKFIVDRFRTHDNLMVQEQYKVRHDEKTFLDVSRQGAEQLARVLREDAEKTYIEPAGKLPQDEEASLSGDRL
ncbi:monovalent cation:proton antiporter-2 (CPA2) family protein [Bdellovibrio sp. HCB337]|uniref:monovalent cation:proton antiporter-2 (CPA2) family protein n=1 Tax=Bdellovibrio sp. HCB337 TaxID=3394358 RepID=UPI0039A6BD20